MFIKMLVDVSNGELIDKITILEIKSERIKNEAQLKNVENELNILRKCEFETSHKSSLKKINEMLWDCEDTIRLLDKAGDFGEEFVMCARDIHNFNDERCRIKRMINDETNSSLIEEKSYE
jgi:predicted RNA-binding protein with EMAP domain